MNDAQYRYLLTRYYRRGELTVRFGFFMVVAAGLAGAFGGLLAAGLLAVGKIGSLQGWRNIFLVGTCDFILI